ncbi:hypothetical protein ABL78_8141 [Leptomonas seymouri]|uniref:Transmembrane protein n=1 Tax=Leptomonas seymouri TaxID=5684 RepID=A0A0N0P2S6_LEPSE|nr:hypothetical protein ABL78_8141 [Leptomonas seymouri]|eukprot:KPI82847.1 hypothetical protein ABL78_8141 [Leptomonas seymouri]
MQAVPHPALAMRADSCDAEDRELPSSTAQGREALRDYSANRVGDVPARAEERDQLHGEGIVFVEAGVTTHCDRLCCTCARVICAAVALALTVCLTVDVCMVCWDLYAYGTQPDPYDEGYRVALWRLWCFVPALLECGAMIAFLLRELWLFSCCTTLGSTIGSVSGGEGDIMHRTYEGRAGGLRRKRNLMQCALLITFSLFTATVYLCNFTDPIHPLHHLVLHVQFIWVTLVRCLVFFLCFLVIIFR